MSGEFASIEQALEAAGVPDRVGMFGGLRRRNVGQDRFREAAGRVVEAVVRAAGDEP